MTFVEKWFRQFITPKNVYISVISVAGLSCFFTFMDFSSLTSSQWVLIYALVGSILLLNHFAFRLPPEGNLQSMDSAIYLATNFTFGLKFSLLSLAISTIVNIFPRRKLPWWTHTCNFANYTLMILGSYYLFIYTHGKIGSIQTQFFASYILAMTVYFIINAISVGLYFYISTKGNLFVIIKGMVRDTVIAYISTLLLSLVLSILLDTYRYLGLALFLGISVLLSIGFKELFNLYSEVSQKAIKDQRTGLYNHGYFEELLEKQMILAKEQDTPLSISILDVDNFKKYNDTFGHLKGDKLLEFIASILLEECKKRKFIVARYGGEEFTVLMPGTHEKDAFVYINQLRKKINDSYFEGVEIFPHGCLSFSAGVTEYRKGIIDKSQLLDKADQALYYAKAQGKNLVHIYNEQSIIQKTIDIEHDIQEIEQQLKIFLSKDVYTFQHSKRVFSYAIDICDYIPLTDQEKKTLILGALFHDIGKLEVPKEILKKKEKLTAEEWDTVKKHVIWGKDIVSAIEKYNDLIPLVELHHERFDGRGYPHGLQGEEIPKQARILSVIDSFDAMTTERPYQKTKTFDEAIEELKRCSGEQFDPNFAQSFIDMIHDKYDFKLDRFSNPEQVG
jgi:diguanylate cyclase (GGDEF)-like protein/putative nucleotidyltransferase with HDIG domain